MSNIMTLMELKKEDGITVKKCIESIRLQKVVIDDQKATINILHANLVKRNDRIFVIENTLECVNKLCNEAEDKLKILIENNLKLIEC